MKKSIVLFSAVLAVVAALLSNGCATGGGGYVPSIDREDRALEALVEQRIQADRVARRAMVDVRVEYGFATIRGAEDDPAVLARIASIIRNTPGIKGVERAD